MRISTDIINNCISSEELEKLIIQAQAKDQDALARIFGICTPAVEKCARASMKILPVGTDYDEVCQCAYIGFYYAITTYNLNDDMDFWEWTFRIIRYEVKKSVMDDAKLINLINKKKDTH